MKNMNNDLISRQAAIDELVRWGKIPDYSDKEKILIGAVIGMLSSLPSVQPQRMRGGHMGASIACQQAVWYGTRTLTQGTTGTKSPGSSTSATAQTVEHR